MLSLTKSRNPLSSCCPPSSASKRIRWWIAHWNFSGVDDSLVDNTSCIRRKKKKIRFDQLKNSGKNLLLTEKCGIRICAINENDGIISYWHGDIRQHGRTLSIENDHIRRSSAFDVQSPRVTSLEFTTPRNIWTDSKILRGCGCNAALVLRVYWTINTLY